MAILPLAAALAGLLIGLCARAPVVRHSVAEGDRSGPAALPARPRCPARAAPVSARPSPPGAGTAPYGSGRPR
nr:hypothetical protein GCM10020093_038420 [Planobispora longispora]